VSAVDGNAGLMAAATTRRSTTLTDNPVVVRARLDEPLSGWLWLVKWLLVIPHAIVLAFLWLGFLAVSVVAFFAILFTGQYPRGLFDFNVGVLRWTWRVGYYAYGALGTDRYPPFTLADDPTYPAQLEVQYPDQLSRGLVLVKWWLLAIPQVLIVGAFSTGSYVVGGVTASGERWYVQMPGLLSICVLIAAVAVLFTSRYPRGLFDFVMGINRWVLRVAAYVALITDVYPPFRLDQGADEPRPPDGEREGSA
jgi:Domain of unknown function (DUF4389)